MKKNNDFKNTLKDSEFYFYRACKKAVGSSILYGIGFVLAPAAIATLVASFLAKDIDTRIALDLISIATSGGAVLSSIGATALAKSADKDYKKASDDNLFSSHDTDTIDMSNIEVLDCENDEKE